MSLPGQVDRICERSNTSDYRVVTVCLSIDWRTRFRQLCYFKSWLCFVKRHRSLLHSKVLCFNSTVREYPWCERSFPFWLHWVLIPPKKLSDCIMLYNLSVNSVKKESLCYLEGLHANSKMKSNVHCQYSNCLQTSWISFFTPTHHQNQLRKKSIPQKAC